MPPTCFHRTAADVGRAQVARETNAELLALPEGWEACDPAELLAAVASELGSPQEPTRLAALLWLHTLLGCSRQTARSLQLCVSCCRRGIGDALTLQAPAGGTVVAEWLPRLQDLLHAIQDAAGKLFAQCLAALILLPAQPGHSRQTFHPYTVLRGSVQVFALCRCLTT